MLKDSPPNLGDVEPESPGELELLLVPVVHEAHDDIALVDGLAHTQISQLVVWDI